MRIFVSQPRHTASMRADFKICAQYLSAADKSLFARKQIAAVLRRTGGLDELFQLASRLKTALARRAIVSEKRDVRLGSARHDLRRGELTRRVEFG